MYGFREEVKIEPSFPCIVEKVSRAGLAGKQKNFALGILRTEMDREVYTRHSGHRYIGHEKLRSGLSGGGNGLIRVIEGESMKACLIQNDRKGLRNDRFVIDDENNTFRFGHVPPRHYHVDFPNQANALAWVGSCCRLSAYLRAFHGLYPREGKE
jgi:hypothetical protein